MIRVGNIVGGGDTGDTGISIDTSSRLRPPPNFPCSRMIRFEQTFNPNRADVREIERTYAKASEADVQNECALQLSARIENVAKRRGVSTKELRKQWHEAEKEGRLLLTSGLQSVGYLPPGFGGGGGGFGDQGRSSFALAGRSTFEDVGKSRGRMGLYAQRVGYIDALPYTLAPRGVSFGGGAYVGALGRNRFRNLVPVGNIADVEAWENHDESYMAPSPFYARRFKARFGGAPAYPTRGFMEAATEGFGVARGQWQDAVRQTSGYAGAYGDGNGGTW